MVLLQRKLYFQRIQRGSNVSGGGGGPACSGGGGCPNAYFYRNPYNLRFSRGAGPPIPPLDPHMNIGAVKTDRNRSLNMQDDTYHFKGSREGPTFPGGGGGPACSVGGGVSKCLFL